MGSSSAAWSSCKWCCSCSSVPKRSSYIHLSKAQKTRGHNSPASAVAGKALGGMVGCARRRVAAKSFALLPRGMCGHDSTSKDQMSKTTKISFTHPVLDHILDDAMGVRGCFCHRNVRKCLQQARLSAVIILFLLWQSCRIYWRC